MKTVQEYLRHAHDCEELARKVTDLEHRRMIAQMAETWRMLATQRQKQLDSMTGGADAE
jgi:hypothetical protein